MASQKQIDKTAQERYLEKLKLIRAAGHINPFETDEEKKARIERCKTDVGFMVQYYFPHYATSKSAKFQIKLAKKVKNKKICRILVRWGRGLAKSVWCDIIIPFWLWLNDEEVYLLIVGNNEKKAIILLSDLQAEFESNPAIAHDFGEQKMIGSWEDGYFITKSGFIGQAIGMGQSPRGLRYKNRRPNLIVPDDLDDRDIIKNPKRIDEMADWVDQDLIPVMDGPEQRFLNPNNRAYPKTIQSTLEERHPGWEVDEVAAYDENFTPAWMEKYTADYYRAIEEGPEGIGRLAAQAEYNNRPHVKGKIFKDEQIQWAPLPRLNQFSCIVGHWDVAYSGTGDYNAVKVWGLYDRKFYCIAAFVRQCKMRDAVEWMLDFDEGMPITVKIHWQFESQFWNETVINTIEVAEVKKGRTLNIIRVDVPKVKKYDRIITMQGLYQNGRTYYNVKEKSSNSMQEGINQLKGIEPGYKTHDDSPDADQQAIDRLQKHIGAASMVPELGYDERPYQNY